MLEVVNIHKTFKHLKHELHVLKGIHLTVKESSIFSIVGPSGAGKSTVITLLIGEEKPTKGRIFFSKYEVGKLTNSELFNG